jgi:hypothetical protein
MPQRNARWASAQSAISAQRVGRLEQLSAFLACFDLAILVIDFLDSCWPVPKGFSAATALVVAMQINMQ